MCGTLVLIINLLRLFYSKFLNGVFEKMYRWRWLIAAIVFVVLLCFQIHTSNAACYMYSFTGKSGSGTVHFNGPSAYSAGR